MPSPCPRCADCQGKQHHWLPTGGHLKHEYACQHCDAAGEACFQCGADPELDLVPRDPECPVCGGDGIAEIETEEL